MNMKQIKKQLILDIPYIVLGLALPIWERCGGWRWVPMRLRKYRALYLMD